MKQADADTVGGCAGPSFRCQQTYFVDLPAVDFVAGFFVVAFAFGERFGFAFAFGLAAGFALAVVPFFFGDCFAVVVFVVVFAPVFFDAVFFVPAFVVAILVAPVISGVKFHDSPLPGTRQGATPLILVKRIATSRRPSVQVNRQDTTV